MYQNYPGGKNTPPQNPVNSAQSQNQQLGQQPQGSYLVNPQNPALLNPNSQSNRASHTSMIIPQETVTGQTKPLAGFGKL